MTPLYNTGVGVDATREIFANVYSCEDGGTMQALGGKLAGLNQCAFSRLITPHDYTTISELVAVIVPQVTDAALQVTCTYYFASNGQAYGTHTDTDAAGTYNVTDGQIYEIDLATLFPAIGTTITANEYLIIKLLQRDAADNFSFCGIRLRYT